MKKIIYILPFLFLASCGMLDEKARAELSEEKVNTDAQSVYYNSVSTLYNYIGGYAAGEGLQGPYRGVYDLQTFTTDEAIIPTRGGDWYDGGLWQSLFLHDISADNEVVENSWKYLYKVVVLCNRSLALLDEYRSLLSDDEYTAYQAEVRALRAMYYYYLIDLFGDVPLVTKADVAVSDIVCSPRKDVFDFTIQELEAVLPLLSADMSQKRGEQYGHITQPVVCFVLMKMYLNSEVWTGTPMWQETEKYANKIADYGYHLDAAQTDCFRVNNENSEENIFTIPMDKTLYRNQIWNMFRSLHYQHGSAIGEGGENGSCATIETLQTFGYGTNQTDPRFYTSFYADTVYNLQNEPLTLTDGSILIYHPLEVKLVLTGSPYMVTAGARMKKYQRDPTGIFDSKLRSNDIVLFRYADVLLTLAEAKIRQGKDGSAELNQVRNRAGAAEREATLENVLEERKLELVWEGWRRQDMIRFGIYTQSYTDRPALPNEPIVFPLPQFFRDLNPNL